MLNAQNILCIVSQAYDCLVVFYPSRHMIMPFSEYIISFLITKNSGCFFKILVQNYFDFFLNKNLMEIKRPHVSCRIT
uniref:Uncharacterized protein n=1 Tax=Anguilla anguilla TaxID=7936 RepID=A0A0E9XXL7_ANGAN